VARGAAFEGTKCEVTTGTCVSSNLGDGGGDGGDGGHGDSGNEGGKGEGGKPAIPCKKYSDCPAQTATQNFACDIDIDNGTCVNLYSTDCPFVIGDVTNDNAPPIFIGAFATFPASGNTEGHPSFLNYAEAINELGNNGDGIQIGSSLRTPVAVVCDDESDPNVVIPHLINDAHIAVLVAALNTTTLLTAFSNTDETDASTPKVLFINPFGSDGLFPVNKEQGLLWSLLGQPSDVTQAYQAFFPLVESYVRQMQNIMPEADGGTAPLRVASMTPNSADPQQLSASVQKALAWASNPNYVYKDFPLKYSSLNANFTTTEGLAQATTAANSIAAFKPNVVVSFGSEEDIEVISDLDFDWETSAMGPKPFYLVGPYNAESPGLTSWIGIGTDANTGMRRLRVAGINFASAPANDPVLVTYTNNFMVNYPQAPASATGYNNYYDAMYFAVYSLAAASPQKVPLTGDDTAQGMVKITNAPGSGTSIAMGSASIATFETTVVMPGNQSNVSLDGTLGPPDFNQITGARVGQGDVYCVNRYPQDAAVDEAGTTLAAVPYYSYDVLRLAGPDGGAPVDGSVPDLEGTFPCYDGMAP
jgi:hypothetical protein